VTIDTGVSLYTWGRSLISQYSSNVKASTHEKKSFAKTKAVALATLIGTARQIPNYQQVDPFRIWWVE